MWEWRMNRHVFFFFFDLFFLYFTHEINYWWSHPISVSLIRNEKPKLWRTAWSSGESDRGSHCHLVSGVETVTSKAHESHPWRPFWHTVSDHINAVGYHCMYSRSPLAQVTGCRVLISKSIPAPTWWFVFPLSDWLRGPSQKLTLHTE